MGGTFTEVHMVRGISLTGGFIPTLTGTVIAPPPGRALSRRYAEPDRAMHVAGS